MPDIHKVSVALTGEQVEFLRTVVKGGEYATTSEAVREALRDWRWKKEARGEELRQLRESWHEGKASGRAVPVEMSKLREKARARSKKSAARTA
ncbi:MAG TPA: type II toxin-antitoxin system ParD family antitoxin [Acidobacteriaceae bacterium]